MSREFLSGNEAFAHGVRLARPQVVSAYPITPQTIVVERLSEMVADGSLGSEFIHVESEHSAMSAAMGASSVGARAFTATSSQGLLYMAECLPYAAGGRMPIVMMNANRSVALPWNIYGDQRDSLSQLDCGWIQAYAQDAQEALDLALMAYRIAEDPSVRTPFMANLDGFRLTHTYEVVDVPTQEEADAFLPPFVTQDKMDLASPKNMAFTAGPEHNTAFIYKQHAAMLRAADVVDAAEEEFAGVFGRRYAGALEAYRTEGADTVLVTLGSISPLVRSVADALRDGGARVGAVRLRYMRPFPKARLADALAGARTVAVLDQDISPGFEGAVFTEINSALMQAGAAARTVGYIGGLGGKPITKADIIHIFEDAPLPGGGPRFLGLPAGTGGYHVGR